MVIHWPEDPHRALSPIFSPMKITISVHNSLFMCVEFFKNVELNKQASLVRVKFQQVRKKEKIKKIWPEEV